MTVAATVAVQTLPDGRRQLHCWLCANNYSVDLHIPFGASDDQALAEPLQKVHQP